MRNVKIKIHWSFAVLSIFMFIFGKFAMFFCAIVAVLLHEMGHSVVGRKLGYKLDLITLLPYGAMLSGKNSPFNTKDEIKIAIAGPIVNAVLILSNIILWRIFPSIFNISNNFFSANVFTLIFNLLPVYPLDGGRILIAVLSSKMPRAKAEKKTKVVGYIITIAFFVLFFVSFFYKLNYMLGINAIFLLIGLFEEDSSPYYQNIKNFETISYFSGKKNVAKLEATKSLFDAYKLATEKNIKQIVVCKNGKVLKCISKNKVLTSVLNQPIDTKLEKLID